MRVLRAARRRLDVRVHALSPRASSAAARPIDRDQTHLKTSSHCLAAGERARHAMVPKPVSPRSVSFSAKERRPSSARARSSKAGSPSAGQSLRWRAPYARTQVWTQVSVSITESAEARRFSRGSHGERTSVSEVASRHADQGARHPRSLRRRQSSLTCVRPRRRFASLPRYARRVRHSPSEHLQCEHAARALPADAHRVSTCTQLASPRPCWISIRASTRRRSCVSWPSAIRALRLCCLAVGWRTTASTCMGRKHWRTVTRSR